MSLKGLIDNVSSVFKGAPKSSPSVGRIDYYDKLLIKENVLEKSYKIVEQNWYSAKPYGFKTLNENGKSIVMFLPISPNNLTISTNFATNMIPTLYGTVEEHSPVRYYDISIEGTTGFAPKYIQPVLGQPKNAHDQSLSIKTGRSSFSVSSELSLGGFFPKTLSLINKTLNKAADLLDGGPSTKMGIVNENSGYVAFHNLYRFLLYYKKVSSGEIPGGSEVHKRPLTFFNYKDNNEYSVVVKSFTLRRSAENPMLYSYNIQMRGYSLRTIGEDQQIREDLKARLENLGLNGVKSSSIFGSIKSISSNVKSGVGAVLGGIGGFGR